MWRTQGGRKGCVALRPPYRLHKLLRKVTVVGSGASGVHFALTLLRKGYDVLMIDGGQAPPSPVAPQHSFDTLKRSLDDPARYFLGKDFEAVIYPDDDSEFYGFPPSKRYVFAQPPAFDYAAEGFEPLFSFAQGGLAQAWTAGVYPFNDEELRNYPFSYADIAPFYGEVARRIGIAGVEDDLAQFFPVHDHLHAPLTLDSHSAKLLDRYERAKRHLNEKLGCYLGRTRIAVLSQSREGRDGCSYRGRCLWGCPTRAFYTPLITLEECRTFSRFEYVPNRFVRRFTFDAGRRITGLVAAGLDGDREETFPVETLALAAGTLSTAQIFLNSIYEQSGEVATLSGLMDNRQILMPFVNLRMLGKPCSAESYQYHQVGMGLTGDRPEEYIHGQITTLKTGLFHPVIQQFPLDLRSATSVFRQIHAALGVANINLHDTRRAENLVTLAPAPGSEHPRLSIRYEAASSEQDLLQRTIRRTAKALRRLGCIVPPGMTHIRPMGASVHYTGTLPMSAQRHTYTTSPLCRSHDFDNLFVVDGSTFPFLPAKNLTFTLMANAVRVATQAF